MNRNNRKIIINIRSTTFPSSTDGERPSSRGDTQENSPTVDGQSTPLQNSASASTCTQGSPQSTSSPHSDEYVKEPTHAIKKNPLGGRSSESREMTPDSDEPNDQLPRKKFKFFDENGLPDYDAYIAAGFGFGPRERSRRPRRWSPVKLTEEAKERIRNYDFTQVRRERSRSRSRPRVAPASSKLTWERHYKSKAFQK